MTQVSSVSNLYDRLVNSRWPEPCPAPTPEEAMRGAKRLYRVAMGRPWRGKVKLVSGNRHTWIKGGVLLVNPARDDTPQWAREYRRKRGFEPSCYTGWQEIVHSISHYCHHRLHPDARSHNDKQAYLERDLTKYVIEHGWLNGRLKPKTVDKPPRDIIKERYARVLVREQNWARKFTRAKRALSKATRERGSYEKKYGSRVTS